MDRVPSSSPDLEDNLERPTPDRHNHLVYVGSCWTVPAVKTIVTFAETPVPGCARSLEGLRTVVCLIIVRYDLV